MQKRILENVCSRTKIDLQLKKKNKKDLEQIQNYFVSPSKKTLVIQFQYMGIV